MEVNAGISTQTLTPYTRHSVTKYNGKDPIEIERSEILNSVNSLRLPSAMRPVTTEKDSTGTEKTEILNLVNSLKIPSTMLSATTEKDSTGTEKTEILNSENAQTETAIYAKDQNNMENKTINNRPRVGSTDAKDDPQTYTEALSEAQSD
jgi:hypothetical protein